MYRIIHFHSFGVSNVVSKQINNFIYQGCIKLIKCDLDFYNITKDCPINLLLIKNPEKNIQCLHKNIKQHNCFSTLIIIRNVS